MIAVNGQAIDEHAVAAEMQHHPAPDAETAREAAAQALAVRALLTQRAQALGIEAEDENERLDALMACEVLVPEPDSETCRRYYDRHRHAFRSPTLFEAAHILIAAPSSNRTAHDDAIATAKTLIEELKAAPDRFDKLAETWSACPSRLNGGRLGQVARGDTVPEFDTFLENLEPGQLCPVPVPTRFGAHVLRLDRRIEGRDLPFEVAEPKIAAYLSERGHALAVQQYIGQLAAAAEIRGVSLPDPDLPSAGLSPVAGDRTHATGAKALPD